jgi:hypothetical protein
MMDDECEDCGVTLTAREASFNDGLCDDCQMCRDDVGDGDFAGDWGQA